MNKNLTILMNDKKQNRFQINARNIWEKLGSKQKFTDWISYQAAKYELKADVDFITFIKNMKVKGSKAGERNMEIREYALTQSAARLILEDAKGFERGIELRKQHDTKAVAYEDILKELATSPVKALEFALQVAKQNEQNEKRLEILSGSERKYTSTDLAKELGLVGPKTLNKILIDNKILYRDKKGDLQPYYTYSTQGYFVKKQTILENEKEVYHLYFTQKGREMVLNKFAFED